MFVILMAWCPPDKGPLEQYYSPLAHSNTICIFWIVWIKLSILKLRVEHSWPCKTQHDLIVTTTSLVISKLYKIQPLIFYLSISIFLKTPNSSLCFFLLLPNDMKNSYQIFSHTIWIKTSKIHSQILCLYHKPTLVITINLQICP